MDNSTEVHPLTENIKSTLVGMLVIGVVLGVACYVTVFVSQHPTLYYGLTIVVICIFASPACLALGRYLRGME